MNIVKLPSKHISWGIAILLMGFGVGLPMIFPVIKDFEELFWYASGVFVGRAIMISEIEEDINAK